MAVVAAAAVLRQRSNSTIPMKQNSAVYKTMPLLLLTSAAQRAAVYKHWKTKADFGQAQASVLVVLAVAYIGNNWPYSYDRNQNESMPAFWAMNVAILVAGAVTLTHDSNASSRGVQLLSRPQTEEWKGWMQWAFIMYHYYRARSIYNEIRVFVSAYVWMTGFGNFQYFDKKGDFTVTRAVSMWLRINYFPLLLSVFLRVPLELYYVVPLHTAAFFITMVTCYVAQTMHARQVCGMSRDRCNQVAILLCLLAHALFYETRACRFLLYFGDETSYYFRFRSDRYSAWVGILSGYCWGTFKSYMQWAYSVNNNNSTPPTSNDETATDVQHTRSLHQQMACWAQRIAGVTLIGLWYGLFGWITDKFIYNPLHPYVFWMPVAGWLMLRNSSKYLCELHSGALEFFGRITLETYVLQFHVFMCRDVQHILVLLPGSGVDGHAAVKFINMLVCGVGFVALAHWARSITVTTQTSVTELLELVMNGVPSNGSDDETAELTKSMAGHGNGQQHNKPTLKAKMSDVPPDSNNGGAQPKHQADV